MSDPAAPRFPIPLIHRWLMDARHDDDGGAAFLRGLSQHLLSVGLPLWRISYALMTMHPEVLWRTVQWRDGQEVLVRDQPHTRLGDDFYQRSAVMLARKGTAPVRVRLTEGALPFPICEELRAQGGTDYYVQGLPFANGQVSYVSYATQTKEGFTDDVLEVFEAIRPYRKRIFSAVGKPL